MNRIQAVGIDLGTTYSCIAWLNEFGQPTTIPNQEGELSTPSVVFFDGDEAIVGTEALRNAIARPARVIQNSKRHMGNAGKFWEINGQRHSPEDIASLVLRKLLLAAEHQIGPIEQAVITVPAQFSDAARTSTIRAGLKAGLKKVEVINEPVAAALCHVLGSEGLAFTELAIDQQILVYDLGGGTLDLAIVAYAPNQVRVVASDGDLELGGLDWTQVLVDIAAERFIADFQQDPRTDPESHQSLALEAEQAKRSLSVRPRAAMTVQHAGNRKTYQIEQSEFEAFSRRLLNRSDAITRRILTANGFGWAHIDVVLTTGGSSRMPMVRESLKKLSGRTLNSTLSPDQSIAHGAAYYAGMLLANQKYARTVFDSQTSTRLAQVTQRSVNARGLGILIRDTETGKRVPHYLIPPNTPLPASRTSVFGTVVNRQTKVHVRIVESGLEPGQPHTILGDCVITQLPTDLPEGTEVEVTISYDHQARVHVAARELTTGISAEAELIRSETPANPDGASTGSSDSGSSDSVAVIRLSESGLLDSGLSASEVPVVEGLPDRSLSDEWRHFNQSSIEFAQLNPAPSSEMREDLSEEIAHPGRQRGSTGAGSVTSRRQKQNRPVRSQPKEPEGDEFWELVE
ncbi:MAG: Hsp70 family protein [Planctomycetaceae bacterium]